MAAFAAAPLRFGETWRAAREQTVAWDDAWIHGNPLRGVVRCVVPGGLTKPPTGRIAHIAIPLFSGTIIGEVLPEHAWVALPSAAADRLAHGVRRAFDPHDILNPGILGATPWSALGSTMRITRHAPC